MKNWKEVLMSPSTTIKRALEIIDSSSLQIVLVVDENSCLLGTVTDGDVRRGILKGVPFEDLTDVFEDVSETVYYDTCCHFNQLGYGYVSERIADRLIRLAQSVDRAARE